MNTILKVSSSIEFTDALVAFFEQQFSPAARSPASKTARDLLLNFKTVTEKIRPPDLAFILLALSTLERWSKLSDFLKNELIGGAEPNTQLIQECIELSALINMHNTYYKFQGAQQTHPNQNIAHDSEYQRIGLRHSATLNPRMGKERYEMIAFCISVLNGCVLCMNSHQEKLLNLGVTPAQIHDLARLSAVTKGLATLAHS